jgi:hypothetical protein
LPLGWLSRAAVALTFAERSKIRVMMSRMFVLGLSILLILFVATIMRADGCKLSFEILRDLDALKRNDCVHNLCHAAVSTVESLLSNRTKLHVSRSVRSRNCVFFFFIGTFNLRALEYITDL